MVSARRGDGTLIEISAEQSRGLPFGSQIFRFCDRDLVLAAALGDEHRITQSGGGRADRSLAGVSGGQFGAVNQLSLPFTIGRAARPHGLKERSGEEVRDDRTIRATLRCA